MRHVTWLGLAALVVGCAGKTDPEGDGGGSDTGGITTQSDSTLTGDGSMTSGSSVDTSAGSGSVSASSSASGSDTGGSGDGSTGGVNDPTNPLDCGGKIYACGNGEDDDGDGKVDLDDPECTGPCDDDEGSFQTGLPGDNVDCKQDCFFDGNSGQGDDGCNWDLKCDPENPGANVGCEYTGGNNCENIPEQDPGCIEFCGQYTPPGCDCFGCCQVDVGDGTTVNIFLNSGPDCSLANLDGCQPCTFQGEECGNPCEPGTCEVCFGEDELPEGCDPGTGECTSGESCEATSDCPTDWFCYLQCCYPPPPG